MSILSLKKINSSFSLTIYILCLSSFLVSCTTTTVHTTVPYQKKNLTKHNNDPLSNIDKRNADLPQDPKEAVVNKKCPCDANKPEEQKEGDSNGFYQVGLASWYGRDFDGKPTASGEIFDSRKLTAAHKKIPLGSVILVRNMANDKEVFLKVNDRGPFIKGRILDVSEYAAELLDYKEDGLTHVGIRIVRHSDTDMKAANRGSTYDYFRGTQQNVENQQAQGSSQDYLENEDHYSVQVGAFSEFRHARKIQNRMKQYNKIVRIIQNNDKYIVRLGSLENSNQAENLKNKLIKNGYSRAFVIAPD